MTLDDLIEPATLVRKIGGQIFPFRKKPRKNTEFPLSETISHNGNYSLKTRLYLPGLNGENLEYLKDLVSKPDFFRAFKATKPVDLNVLGLLEEKAMVDVQMCTNGRGKYERRYQVQFSQQSPGQFRVSRVYCKTANLFYDLDPNGDFRNYMQRIVDAFTGKSNIWGRGISEPYSWNLPLESKALHLEKANKPVMHDDKAIGSEYEDPVVFIRREMEKRGIPPFEYELMSLDDFKKGFCTILLSAQLSAISDTAYLNFNIEIPNSESKPELVEEVIKGKLNDFEAGDLRLLEGYEPHVLFGIDGDFYFEVEIGKEDGIYKVLKTYDSYTLPKDRKIFDRLHQLRTVDYKQYISLIIEEFAKSQKPAYFKPKEAIKVQCPDGFITSAEIKILESGKKFPSTHGINLGMTRIPGPSGNVRNIADYIEPLQGLLSQLGFNEAEITARIANGTLRIPAYQSYAGLSGLVAELKAKVG